ncbi:MAG: hypothetical protein NVSMB32_16380 [Actinomycetota bacterium]
MSTGHIVMVVAGLLAALLTFSVLRQAGGRGSDVLVAARAIRAGERVDPSMFTQATIKAPGQVLVGTVRPDQQAGLVGRVARADLERGQLVLALQFVAAVPLPPRMTVLVDPQAIPGGPPSILAGSRVDVIGLPGGSAAPLVVGGLVVVKPPDQAKGSQPLSGSSLVAIEVEVPDPLVAVQLAQATSSKFLIRLSDPPPPAGGAPR